ncbi:antitoxin Xre/MbcA/ParS toxin-binding domain-containing protein [Gallaecimonas sp. GXIMD4217]|uniref:type II RES/Xre toxin-antitoxin system antitoxin n=1 Tax=Gallaecimonas sp. GXIMD4217 TaxID=3131927 RepID=UPI00311B3D35
MRFIAATSRKGKGPRNALDKVIGHQVLEPGEVLREIRQGLNFGAVEVLLEELKTTKREIGNLLSIPASTLRRRELAGRLHVDESDRVVRYARLKDAAVQLMHGDNEAAVQWLHTPQQLLQNETPIQHATTEVGAREVEDLIGRLRHGVFS